MPALQPAEQPTRHSAVLGVGSYRPSRVVPNSELVEAIDSSDEWIQQRSGIIERRFATEDETVQMMSVAAARQALEHAGVEPAQLDCVIVATVSHFMQTPAIATAIAFELGTERAAAFDISAACAGFCHGVGLASDLVRGGTARHVLVIGVERLSDQTDPTDRGTAFIFADGAGAVVVGPSDEPGIGPTVWGSDGEQFELIRSRADWRDYAAEAAGDVAAFHTDEERPESRATVAGDDPDGGDTAKPSYPYLAMQGNPVFRWASFEMAKTARQALEATGITVDELDVFVPHQANMRIIDAMARSLKLPATVKIARDIAHQGNTSAASIPLALRAMIDDGQAKSGDLALLIAFGAGLAYAAQVIRVP